MHGGNIVLGDPFDPGGLVNIVIARGFNYLPPPIIDIPTATVTLTNIPTISIMPTWTPLPTFTPPPPDTETPTPPVVNP